MIIINHNGTLISIVCDKTVVHFQYFIIEKVNHLHNFNWYNLGKKCLHAWLTTWIEIGRQVVIVRDRFRCLYLTHFYPCVRDSYWFYSGNLAPRRTPQLVLLTFDDAVNDLNKELYRDLFEKGRLNPNGCPIAATFYVSHEWTDYGQVQSLYADGHEIASHTISWVTHAQKRTTHANIVFLSMFVIFGALFVALWQAFPLDPKSQPVNRSSSVASCVIRQQSIPLLVELDILNVEPSPFIESLILVSRIV